MTGFHVRETIKDRKKMTCSALPQSAPRSTTPSAPWLSVIVPVFNVEPYLRACIESIASQAEKDREIEIICVEDVSTDGSAALLERLRQEWPQYLRVLHHPRNSGLSVARNTGLEAATGRYLWFIDSDDLLEPGAVAELRAIVERHAPDLVMCDFRVLRQHVRLKHRLRGEAHRRSFGGPSGLLLHDPAVLMRGLLEQDMLHSWSKISRRELWHDLRFPPNRYFEDQTASPRLALRANSYYHAARVWVAYRQREGSILAAPSLKKTDDASAALLGMADEIRAREGAFTAEVQLALAYACARGYRRVARQLARGKFSAPARRLHAYRDNFLRSAAMDIPRMRREFLKRGWLLRWLRLSYWLRKADS
ncbi:MAG: glycosyltransferase [Burkholderiaceae bacterium]|jgi:glycosyltransferase involved in cell wall biosynthesis|nr:glycosyltransferase [Burkholderiaceae bacterium]